MVNSGMVVEMRPEDIPGDGVLRMLDFQERLENDCWQQGNMKQTAPAQRMADFVNNRLSYDLPKSSYAPGLISSPLHFWLPPSVSKRLQQGFRKFGSMSHGFLTNEAVLIAVETRTSSPVRILRDADTLQHVRIKGFSHAVKVPDMPEDSLGRRRRGALCRGCGAVFGMYKIARCNLLIFKRISFVFQKVPFCTPKA